jgi:uncharacterized SAM-binding protein YcdF (DUF218 family)
MGTVDQPAKIVWDYMQMHETLAPAEAIFVLCSMDTRVAECAAQLYAQGYGRWIIISGGLGKLTKDRFDKPEAQIFADIITKTGVPEERLIIEDQSTNTGENVRFTYQLLNEQDRHFKSLILVQKPYMERRTFATFKKQWPDPDTKIAVTSPKIAYEDYFTEDMPKDFVINIMVGDLQRILEYPKLGLQIEQPVPSDVLQTYERLVRMGYTKHLLDDLS